MSQKVATVTVNQTCHFGVGDRLTVGSIWGIDYGPKSPILVVYRIENGITLHLASIPLSRWARFWYYLRTPKLWAYALDIPFAPPDIYVRF